MKLLIVTQRVDKNDSVLGFFTRWIEEFAKHCEQVTVICLYKGEYTPPANVKVLSLGKESGISRFKYLKRFFSYIWNERKNYDTVFVHMNVEYVVLAGWLWRMMSKKIGLWYTHKHVGLRLRTAVFFSHIVFSASRESFRLPTPKIHITGHGIDTNVFKPGQTQASISHIITVGRISPVKKYEILIDAVKNASMVHPEIRFMIVGGPGKPEDASYIESLHQKVRNEKLENNIFFTGAVPNKDILPLLQKNSIFIHTSETGSLDKALLEPMAVELAVISSSEAVADVLTTLHLTFPKGDREALAKKIIETIEHEADTRKAGKELGAYVRTHHSITNLIPKIISLYNENV